MEPNSSTSQQNLEEQTPIKTSQQLIDINLTFGDDGGQQTLTQIKFQFFSKVSTMIDKRREKFLEEIQSKEEDKKDALLVFKFQVQSGRQRQSFEFIEKGLDQDQENQNTSEMQKLFRRPKTSGRIEMKEGKGYIYVIYRFYHEKFSQKDIEDLDKLLESQIDIDFLIDIVLKGKIQPSRRSFTSIKSDFIKMRISSEKITMRDFLRLMEKKGEIDQNVMQSDFYKLIKNLDVARFDLKFNSLRRIMRYYNRILYNEDEMEEIGSKQRVSPLSSKGIFKNFVSVDFFLGEKIAFRADMKYKSEEIMMRLVARMVKVLEGL